MLCVIEDCGGVSWLGFVEFAIEEDVFVVLVDVDLSECVHVVVVYAITLISGQMVRP